MASTTFSGPVTSTNGFVGDVTGDVTGTVILPSTTTAALGAIGNAINTTGKVTGKMVVDLSSGLIYTATGAAAGSAWYGSDGTAAITPA